MTFWLLFHSDYLTPSATALSKRSTMVQMFSLINILNCLPPLIFVPKHICTRLTILTGSKSNHKIKVAETLLWPVGSWQLACTPWTANILLHPVRKHWSHWLKSVQSALSDLLTTSAMHGTFSHPSTKRGLILLGLELNTNATESFEHCWSSSLNLSIDQHVCQFIS